MARLALTRKRQGFTLIGAAKAVERRGALMLKAVGSEMARVDLVEVVPALGEE